MLSIISMTVVRVIEVKRRNQAIKNPLKPMNVFWLSLLYRISSIADMFTVIRLLEFFHKEGPSGMKSLLTSFTWLLLSIVYF